MSKRQNPRLEFEDSIGGIKAQERDPKGQRERPGSDVLERRDETQPKAI